jgi:hypothetical protein
MPGLIFLGRPAKVLGVLKGPDGKQTLHAPRGDRGRDTRINVHVVPDTSTLPQPVTIDDILSVFGDDSHWCSVSFINK